MQKGLEYWHLSGASDASFAIVIVPGNPGLPRLYLPFARALQNTLRSKHGNDACPVYVVSYCGFEQPREHRALPSTLNINHEAQRLHTFLDFVYSEQAKPIIVVAHSIGAWVAVKAIGSPDEYYNREERYPVAHHVHKIVLCMPFLEVDQASYTMRAKMLLLRYRAVRELATFAMHILLCLLPSFVIRVMIKIASDWRGCLRRNPEMENSLVHTFGTSAHYLCATLALGCSEFETLRPTQQSVDWSYGSALDGVRSGECTFFDTYAPRIVLLYSKDDDWAPLSHASLILSNRSIAFHVLDQGHIPVQHAFVLNIDQTQHVAEVICQHIKPRLA